MSVVNAESFIEGLPTQLSLFDLPPTQVAVSNSYFQEIRPVSQITNEAPLEFYIASSNNLDYLLLFDTQIYVKLNVTKADGSALGAGEKVGPVNLFLHSLFSAVEITLQNKAIISCPNYQYCAMIQTLLNYGEDADYSQLLTALFVKDDNDAPQDTDPTGNNAGLAERSSYIAQSKLLDLQGGLHHDLTHSLTRYILNQVDVKIKLYRSSAAFCLSSGEASPGYKINLVDVYILAKKVKVNPAVIYGHAEMLLSTTAKYVYTRTECRVQSIPKENTSFHWDNMFSGRKPCRIAVCFVDEKGFSGDYKSNPYNFQNCGVKSMTLYCDGVPVNGAPWELDFKRKTVARAYSDLYQFVIKSKENFGNDISLKDFMNGYCLFTFHLEPFFDGQNRHMSLSKTGNLRLVIEFDTALTSTMSCIVYSETQGFFQITKERDIITEWILISWFVP